MDILYAYLLKAGACLLLFYAAYRLFFRKETFYHYNRIWLLGAFAGSLLLPLVPFLFKWGGQVLPAAEAGGSPEQAGAAPVRVWVMQHINTWEAVLSNILPWLGIIYAAVAVFLLGVHGLQLLHIRRLIAAGKMTKDGYYRIIRSADIETPFSFRHYIFLPAEAYPPATLKQILLHEKAHAAQGHSWDTLFASFYCCICWFNPFAWMMKKDLLLNLEYLADAAVLEQSVPAKDYQYSLLKIALSNHNSIIVNHFGQSFIKNRITMINKIPSGKRNKWKYFLGLPLIVLAISIGSLNLPTASAQSADKWEGYPGGKEAASKFLSRNIRYPRKAVENKITGIVSVQFTVQPDGSIKDITILQEPDPAAGLGEEVKRVIAMMPKFEARPGSSQSVKKELKGKFQLELGGGKILDADAGTKADIVVVGYGIVRKFNYSR
jgi:TonB family protein